MTFWLQLLTTMKLIQSSISCSRASKEQFRRASTFPGDLKLKRRLWGKEDTKSVRTLKRAWAFPTHNKRWITLISYIQETPQKTRQKSTDPYTEQDLHAAQRQSVCKWQTCISYVKGTLVFQTSIIDLNQNIKIAREKCVTSLFGVTVIYLTEILTSSGDGLTVSLNSPAELW